MRGFLIALGLLFSFSAASAQSVVRDSVYDPVDRLQRHRVRIAFASGDSLQVTCSDESLRPGPSILWTAAQPWSDGVVAMAYTGGGGSPSNIAAGGSRLRLRWPDGSRDEWAVSFSRTGIFTPTRLATPGADRTLRRSEIADGSGFIRQAVKHGGVAFSYPAGDWIRGGEWTFTPAAQEELRSISERCTRGAERLPR